METIKPGFKTSEFCITLVAQVISLMALLGVVPSDQVDGLVKMVVAAITGFMSIVALVSYIVSRTQIKKGEQEVKLIQAETELAKAVNKK